MLLALLLHSCHWPFQRPSVLVFCPEDTPLPAHWKALPGSDSLLVSFSSDLRSLAEDSLWDRQVLILTAGSFNGLFARQQRAIERFVYAGGSLVVESTEQAQPRKWPLVEQLLSPGAVEGKPKNHLISQPESPKVISYGRGTLYRLQALPPASAQSLVKTLYTIAASTPEVSTPSLPQYPDADRFSTTQLVTSLDEPMEMEVLPNQDILLIERKGGIRYYDAQLDTLRTIATLRVNHSQSNGLNGLAVYPDFRHHPWIFVSYTSATEGYQNISRFYLAGDSLILGSEKVLMQVPINPDWGNHASNALEFDAAGNLYIGFGDYTAQPEGYAPIDIRPGHERRDAQRTAGNSESYLGKILRIHPEDDGSYSIPEGNLFPPDGSAGKPEIYVMGCRNPYRFSIDREAQHLYFGDVGPDATVDTQQGSKGYDEINVATAAGYYGWPYAVANNIAYPRFDFATQTAGPKFDPLSPRNESPNNTGRTQLPPSVPAILWYPRGPTREFPYLGKGGVNIMVGPRYHYQLYPFSQDRLPEYFDGKLIFYDWVRGWVNVATLNDQLQVIGVEPLMDSLKFAHPIDLRLGPEGALYVLDYGSQSYSKNLDAGITRISFPRGNRPPVAELQASVTAGAAPLSVEFSAANSRDPDRADHLSYEWIIEQQHYPGVELDHRFESVGVHPVLLRIKDQRGRTAEATTDIIVGNAPPEITIRTDNNRSFYWEGDTLQYHVDISDEEDGSLSSGRIDPDQVLVRRFYEPAPSLGLDAASSAIEVGHLLVQENGCVACHTTDHRSLGPSYTEVAQRYASEPQAVNRLTRKIIQGGRGNWNLDRSMPAHPFIEKAEAEQMVGYILSLTSERTRIDTLEVRGVLPFDQHSPDATGTYRLEVSYQDRGGPVGIPLRGRAITTFISARVPALRADRWDQAALRGHENTIIHADGGYLMYQDKDLTDVKTIRVRLKSEVLGSLEIRLDSPENAPIGQGTLTPIPDWQEVTIAIDPQPSVHTMYFVFRTSEKPISTRLFTVDSFYFSRDPF